MLSTAIKQQKRRILRSLPERINIAINNFDKTCNTWGDRDENNLYTFYELRKEIKTILIPWYKQKSIIPDNVESTLRLQLESKDRTDWFIAFTILQSIESKRNRYK